MYPNKNPSQDMLERDPSCNVSACYVRWSDLPLECPLPDSTLWNGHPRIYLPIHETGEYRCTYCGTLYILEPPNPDEPSPDFANIKIERCYRRALQETVGAAASDEQPSQE